MTVPYKREQNAFCEVQNESLYTKQHLILQSINIY